MSLISSSIGTSSASPDPPISNGDSGIHDGPKLKFLDLSYCTNLTPQGLVAVIDACPLLEVCNVFGCGDAARYLHRVLSLQKSERPGSTYARRRTDGKLLLVKPGWSDVQFDDPNESVPVQFGFGTFMMNPIPSVTAVAPSIPHTSASSIMDEPESVRKVRVNVPGFVGFWEGVRA
ncbi:hypothetical protein HDU85_000824 [Gaertneriomyces sp. JEL0708]|nr:hypothetical protein HDU85_000824 [Gaertneriomyces sp. JEL0708]